MPEYVWALHDFVPQVADEVSFKAGDKIEVVEKDEIYQDGWWKGINPEGKEGLFPRSYTTDEPPSNGGIELAKAEDHTGVAFPNAGVPSSSALAVVNEEADSASAHDTSATYTPPKTEERERALSKGEMAMQATLTDVQKAIEQLGRNNDNDGSRSFSFRSSHDEYSERSDTGTDAEDTDAEDGTEWHRNAREKLALRAQQENEQRLKEATSVPSTPMRVTAPPIDVELSDESDDEEEEDRGNLNPQRRHSEGSPSSQFTSQYPHIPEEDETAEEGEGQAISSSLPAVRTSLKDRDATIVSPLPSTAATIPIPTVSHSLPSPESDSGHIVPSEDYIVPSPGMPEEDLPTATADRLTFTDVPLVASPDPSPNLSAQSKSTEPSPVPAPAPPPPTISLQARVPSPVTVPTLSVFVSKPAAAQAPASTTAPPFVSPQAPAPAPEPVLAATSGLVMPGSLNPLSPMTPENESTPIPPAAAAPSIISSAPSTIKLAPVPIKVNEPLSPTTRTSMPSPGYPLPSPSVSSSGSMGFGGSSAGIQQSLTPATTAMSFRTGGYQSTQQDLSPVGSQDGVRRTPTTHPSEWSLEEVVEWLKSKGFDQGVCNLFIDQEITGDVLLELSPAILKDEIGIVKWGQRQRIMNAVTELRRPRSFTDYDQHPLPTLATSRSQSLNYGHSHTSSVQSSAHQSYGNNSPMGYVGQAFPSNQSSHAISSSSVNMGSGGFSSFGSAESPAYQMPAPEVPMRPGMLTRNGWIVSDPGAPGQASEVTLGNSRSFEAVPEGTALITPASIPRELGGLGLSAPSSPPASRPQTPGTTPSKTSKTRPSQLMISSSDHNLKVTAVGDDQGLEAPTEDRGAMSDPETSNQDSKAKRRRLFGRSTESASLKEKAASLKEVKETNSSRHSKDSTAVVTPSDSHSKISIGDEAPPKRRHSKKRSTDERKASDRLSLFGGSFTGAIGKKARKPVPRLSSGGLSEKSEKAEPIEKPEKSEKSDHDWAPRATFLRMRHHSERKASGRPSTSEGVYKGTEEKASLLTPPPRDRARDPTLLRKRTTSTSEGARSPSSSNSQTPSGMGLKPGKSILEQIGTPDHNGWMRKKSDHYNSWKLRYFVLKGPHLYCLKSNDRSETKIKGYINIVGYKVIADENVDPGRYGFRIVHDSDKPHYFSHDEQMVIREWMKALMKATISRDFTNPVVSSSNIPTIPLTVAQAMNPSPRPPSPTARAATQRAHRRENPNQLSSRDAQVLLMAMPQKSPSINVIQDGERARVESFFTNGAVSGDTPEPATPKTHTASPKVPAPPRPSRETRRRLTSPPPDENPVVDNSLIEWANSHLPENLQITDPLGPLCGGLALLRIAEDIKGSPSQPPVPDSAFPSSSNDEKLDGLFALFDFLLENDVKMGAISINDIRQAKKYKIVQLLQALRSWEEKRRVTNSIGKGAGTGSTFMAGPAQFF